MLIKSPWNFDARIPDSKDRTLIRPFLRQKLSQYGFVFKGNSFSQILSEILSISFLRAKANAILYGVSSADTGDKILVMLEKFSPPSLEIYKSLSGYLF